MGWPEGHPEEGDYWPVHDATLVLDRLAGWLGYLGDLVLASARQAATTWEGGAMDAFGDLAARTATTLLTNAAEARAAAQALRSVALAMEDGLLPAARTAQLARQAAETDLAAAQTRLDRDLALGPAAALGPEARRVRMLTDEIAALTRRLAEIGRERDAEAASAAGKVRAVSFVRSTRPAGGGAPAAFAALGFAAYDAVADLPAWWTTTDLTRLSPEEIRARWDLLTDAQRRALIQSDPLLFGNLDGIPLGWRANANELSLRAEIARLEAELAALRGPTVYDQWGAAHQRGNQARVPEIEELLREYRILLGTAPYQDDDVKRWRTAYYDESGALVGVGDPRRANWPKGSQLLVFDPSRGAMATYHGVFTAAGDIPAGYTNVGLYVPGTGTDIPGWRTGADERGSQLHVDCNTSGLGSQAMIVYSGTPQPQNIPQALSASYAQEMGPALARFANTYVPATPTFTVMGHSYGATHVAQAEALGLRADRVLYVAPAGYGEAPESFPRDEHTYPPTPFGGGGSVVPDTRFLGLDDFPVTGDKPHYVLTSRADTVVGLIQKDPFNIHGDSPTHDPRVTRLETGWLNASKPSAGYVDNAEKLRVPGLDNHSAPFVYGSTAQENMVQVLMGGTAKGWGGPGLDRKVEGWSGSNVFGGANLRPQDESDWPDVPIQ